MEKVCESVCDRRSIMIFDKTLSLLLLFALLPVFLIILLSIKIEGLLIPSSKGPVFYFEKRISKGKEFDLIKFRTIKDCILISLRNRFGNTLSIKKLESNSNNFTTVGSFLIFFYLDELPQLLNIIKGDISFVGPRPYPIKDYYEELRRGILRKKLIRCGLTGLYQIHKGQGLSDVELDNEYIKKYREMSWHKLIAFDIHIIFKSIKMLFKGGGL